MQCSSPQHQWEPRPENEHFLACAYCHAVSWNPKFDRDAQLAYISKLRSQPMSQPQLTPLQLHCLNATPSRKPRNWIKLALAYGLVCFASLYLANILLKLFHQ